MLKHTIIATTVVILMVHTLGSCGMAKNTCDDYKADSNAPDSTEMARQAKLDSVHGVEATPNAQPSSFSSPGTRPARKKTTEPIGD